MIVKTIENENKLIEEDKENECNIVFIDRYELSDLTYYGGEPLDLSLERFNKIVAKHYTFSTLIECRIFQDLLKVFYSNDKGKMCAFLEDEKKMIIKCIDKKYNIVVHDPEYIIKNYFKKSDILQAKTKYFNSLYEVLIQLERLKTK